MNIKPKRLRSQLAFLPSNKSPEELYAIKQKAYLEGNYVFTKDQVEKMGTQEKMALELIGLREYGKRK